MGDAPRVKVEKTKAKASRAGTTQSDYFVSGKLTVNERFQHNVFDIKVSFVCFGSLFSLLFSLPLLLR